MPGLVKTIMVTPGQEVKAGEPLAIVAMAARSMLEP
jgi:propionyl-CoA carboxylase alpha chain